MRVAVVVPLYNHAPTLPLSIRGILAQRRKADQIIIVNDGSDDGGGELAEQLATLYPSIRVIHHPRNQGVVAALNTGLNEATSDYVMCTAADDVMLPALIARATEALARHPEAALFCGEVALTNSQQKVIGFRPSVLPAFEPRYFGPGDAHAMLLKSDNWLCGPTIVYRRDLLVDIGGFDSSLGSLCDGLASRALAVRHGFVFAPEVLATWRVDMNSVSHSNALDLSQREATVDLARKWITQHSDGFPVDYADLFARRYRFSSERVRLNAEHKNSMIHALRLARLFFKYRPVSAFPIFRSMHRARRLSGRRQEVEAILADYASDSRQDPLDDDVSVIDERYWCEKAMRAAPALRRFGRNL